MRCATPILQSAHSTTDSANFRLPPIRYAPLGLAMDQASIFAVEDVSTRNFNSRKG
jgi:hypothetical protein